MPKHISMKTKLLYIPVLIAMTFTACTKLEERHADIYKPVIAPSNPVSDATPLSGNIKGTMLSGKTYTINGDVIVQKGDTLLLQPGVHVNVTNGAGILVYGTFASLGTKEQPNWLTVDGVTRTDGINTNPNTDPAFKGLWRGINGSTDCDMIVVKWTHVEFGGGAAGATIGAALGIANNKNTYNIYFQNPNGILIVEDSWFYGSVDDPIRVTGGKIAILRNTFEKGGLTGGEAFSCKGGTVGDIAYNLCIGMATNAIKISNTGGTNTQTNVRVYNNTIINCGWRRAQVGRGGSVNYEEGAAGKFYNNLMVNCKYGQRVVSSPPADTANLDYGNNFNYGDSLVVTNQFYPPTYITRPKTTDIPNPSAFLPANYKLGDTYDGSSLVGKNNPKFINGPAPLPAGATLSGITVVGIYNFGLTAGSPCIGTGFTGFAPMGVVPVSATFGITELTPPGKDIGAFQTDATGNRH